MEPQLRSFFSSVATSNAAFAIHVTTFGILRTSFDSTQAAIACTNYGIAVFGLASEVTATHFGDETRQWGLAVILEEARGRCKEKLLLLWSLALVCSETFMASLVAYISLPCVVLFFAPAFCLRYIQGREAWKDFSGLHQAWSITAEPLSMISMHHCSVFGLKLKSLITGSVTGPRPGKYAVLVFVLRLGVFIAVVLWQADAVKHDVVNLVSSLRSEGISSPLSARAFVALLCLASLPMHCSAVLCLCFNNSWWKGCLSDERHSKIAPMFLDWRSTRTSMLHGDEM